jgi:hypothetical protein
MKRSKTRNAKVRQDFYDYVVALEYNISEDRDTSNEDYEDLCHKGNAFKD